MVKITRREMSAGLAAAAGTAFFHRPAFAQAGPIKIGVITHLTGFAQIYGDANKTGAEIAAQRINAAGGVNGRQIEIVLRDDKGLVDGTVAAYRELAADGVKFFLCGPISGPSAAIAPLFKDTNNILMAAGPNILSLTHELFNDNVFRVQLTSIPVFTGLGSLVAQKAPDVRDWVALCSDQQVSLDLSNIFLNSLKKAHAKNGVEIKTSLVVAKAGAGDFRPQISQMANSDATGIMNALIGSDSLTFYKQAKAYGFDQRAKLFVDVGANLASMVSIASSTPKSVWTPYYWYPQGSKANPVSEEVYKLTVARTGNANPYGFIALAHDAVVALAEAAKSANSLEAKPLIAALETGSPMGAAGPIVFRKEDHTYIGEMIFINFGADANSKDGIGVNEVVRIPSRDLMEPATPGRKYAIE